MTSLSSAHVLTVRARRVLRGHRVLQAALLCGFWAAGTALVRLTGLPVPGSVVGMLLVLGLLAFQRLSLASVRRGADWLIADMLLFFVPAVLVVLQHHELLGLLGLKIAVVIALSTVSVMIVTGLSVDLFLRRR
ncbi:MAG TPA: CidA/LrgA family protein [Alphaproteobacteria bacterium]|nr:CidA/LrgA family protein [Alphaproteobacteria bacterium]